MSFVAVSPSFPDTVQPPSSPLSATTIPDLDLPDREQRSSTETTIVTIYSMYEEDTRSWSASRHHSKDLDVDVTIASRDSFRDSLRTSFLQSTSSAVDDSAFYDSTGDWPRASKRFSMEKGRHSVLSSGSALLAYSDSRPPSAQGSHRWNASQSPERELKLPARSRPSSRNHKSALSHDSDKPIAVPSQSLESAQSRPPQNGRPIHAPDVPSHSRMSSMDREPEPAQSSSRPASRARSNAAEQSSLHHGNSLPLPRLSTATSATSEFSSRPGSRNYLNDENFPEPSSHVHSPSADLAFNDSPAPSRPASRARRSLDKPTAASPPLPTHATLTPPPPSQSLLQVPSAPESSPPQRRRSPAPSQHSLVPSDGEDPDGFHVRSTYAELEVCGVKGDGYEEGVERTRARVGGSRASELRALEALGDGQEKTRELTEKEISMLASLDRYGFYVTPSHDRILLLPVAPLLKPLAHVATFPPKAPATPSLLQAPPPVPPPIKETSRTAKWGRMLEAKSRDEGGNIDVWGIRASKEHKLRERTFKGIPDCWRSAAWETLICRFSKTNKAEMRKLMQDYRAALDQPSTYDIQIDLDVPRTISGHVMFRTRYGQGQRSMFHVLHCLSLRCETCGYCQGMGPIAATFLCYFEPERAYAALVLLHDSYAMHTIFSPGFPGLLEAIYVQERLMEQMLPAVYAAFKKHMISTTSYATKWYITLFANSVPFQTQLRLWDAFLLEGHDIFVVVALAIVWVYRDHITSEAASFETVLSLLSSFFVPEDENALMAWIEKVISDKKLRSSMRQWRADWNRLVASGQHNSALL